jgi:hypothetical protein
MRSRSKEKQAAEATFVFKGVIKKLKASNVKQAPVTSRTAIVTVNQVIEAPPNLARYAGQDITVELSSPRKLNAGQRMIFHASGWLFGEAIAVRSLFEERDETAVTTTDSESTAARRGERQTREHFAEADLVISGRVVEVRLPKRVAAAKKKAAASQITTRVSEHDPKWREAIVEVDGVHKGRSSKRRVIIRFPSSTDVAWRRAPKFEAGQQGFFILHKTEDPEKSTSARSARASSFSQTYTVRDPVDFQSYTATGGIKSLIESQSGNNRE